MPTLTMADVGRNLRPIETFGVRLITTRLPILLSERPTCARKGYPLNDLEKGCYHTGRAFCFPQRPAVIYRGAPPESHHGDLTLPLRYGNWRQSKTRLRRSATGWPPSRLRVGAMALPSWNVPRSSQSRGLILPTAEGLDETSAAREAIRELLADSQFIPYCGHKLKGGTPMSKPRRVRKARCTALQQPQPSEHSLCLPARSAATDGLAQSQQSQSPQRLS